MENYLDIFTKIPMAGAIALLGFFLIKDVISPLINVLINKRNGVGKNLENKINFIEQNHLSEINRRLEVLENNDIRIYEKLNKNSEEIAYLKAKIK